MAKELFDQASGGTQNQASADFDLTSSHHASRWRLRLAVVTTDPVLENALRQASTKYGKQWLLDCYSGIHGALKRIPPAVPDVALIDVCASGGSGLKILSAFHAALPAVPVVAVSAGADRLDVLRVLLAGAAGHLAKSANPSEMASVVLGANAGIGALDRQAREALMSWTHGLASFAHGDNGLNCEERKFLACLDKHYATKDIADALGLAFRSVDAVRSQVYRKLGVHSSADALRKYRELRG